MSTFYGQPVDQKFWVVSATYGRITKHFGPFSTSKEANSAATKIRRGLFSLIEASAAAEGNTWNHHTDEALESAGASVASRMLTDSESIPEFLSDLAIRALQDTTRELANAKNAEH